MCNLYTYKLSRDEIRGLLPIGCSPVAIDQLVQFIVLRRTVVVVVVIRPAGSPAAQLLRVLARRRRNVRRIGFARVSRPMGWLGRRRRPGLDGRLRQRGLGRW